MIRTRSAPAGSRVLDESKEGAYHSLYRVRRVKYASSSSQSKLCSGQCAAARGWTAWTAQPRISATGTAARHASGWRQRPNLNSEDSGLRAMRPSSRSQSAATTALSAGICELFRVKRLRENPTGYCWWIFRGVNPLGFSPALLRGGDGRLGRSLDPILPLLSVLPFMDNSVCDGGDIHNEVSSQTAEQPILPDTLHFRRPRRCSSKVDGDRHLARLWLARSPVYRCRAYPDTVADAGLASRSDVANLGM